MFYKNLRRIREAAGISRVELAAGAGISESLLKFYELGYRVPRVVHVIALSNILNVTTDELLKDTVTPAV